MATANIKIPLTYLWADEFVMLEDFSRKISAKMTDWANAFYGRYGFELDVEPKPLLRTYAGASKYVLAKNDGVRPDMRDVAEVFEEQWVLVQVLKEKVDVKEKEMDDADRRSSALKVTADRLAAELDRLRREWSLTTNPAERQRLDGLILGANIDYQASKSEYEDAQSKYYEALHAWATLYRQLAPFEDALNAKIDNGDHALRSQMGRKFSEGIGSDKRINIVFCHILPGEMAMRSTGRTLGEYRPPLGEPIVSILDKLLLWPYAYIIVDLYPKSRKTLAHELGHFVGPHPGDLKWYVGMAKRVSTLKFPRGSLWGAPISDLEIKFEAAYPKYKTIAGGYFHGAANDIMNYTFSDLEPEDYILEESDRKRLGEYFTSLQASGQTGP